jgi:hypothetical protein
MRLRYLIMFYTIIKWESRSFLPLLPSTQHVAAPRFQCPAISNHQRQAPSRLLFSAKAKAPSFAASRNHRVRMLEWFSILWLGGEAVDQLAVQISTRRRARPILTRIGQLDDVRDPFPARTLRDAFLEFLEEGRLVLSDSKKSENQSVTVTMTNTPRQPSSPPILHADIKTHLFFLIFFSFSAL